MLRRASEFWWLLLAGLLCCSSCQSVPSSFENKTGGQNDNRPRIFSPRMDYDEWTPLGRGDPLKNNPTFDYVPPVLDRVQYWLDTQQQHTTEPSSKRDILVLGVTAKKTSPKIPEQFLKFVDGPKFTRTGSQDTISYRNDYTGSTGAEPPKIMRTTSFRNGVVDYRNQNRLQALPASYYPSSYYNQKKPYTMMMPPPMIQKTETSTSFNVGAVSKDKVLISYPDIQPFSTQTEEGPLLQDVQYYGAPSKDYYSPAPPSRPYSTSKAPPPSKIETIKSVYVPSAAQTTKSKYEATTAPSVSFEKSNLIYQSTQTLSGGWLGNNRLTSSSSTNYPTDLNQQTWQSTDYSKDHYEVDHHAAASSNHEVVVGQNANIVVDGSNNGNEEVVVGQKEVSTESSTSESITPTSIVISTSTSTDLGEQEETTTDTQPAQKMHIVVANSPSSIADLETHKAKKGPVAVVMPTNYMERNTSAMSDPPTMHNINAWGNVATSEMTKTTHEAAKPPQAEPTRNVITSSPILPDDHQSATLMPSKMIPSSQLSPHQPSHPSSVPVMPTRHTGGPPHMFMPPQAASQSMMRPQGRPPNHAMMHFIGSMRPGFRPSSSMSMSPSHISPPMAHMHVSPMKNMVAPSPTMEQAHQRPPQPPFPVTFTSPPSSSTSSMQNIDIDEQPMIDHRPPSRLPATTANSMITSSSSSFTPTVSSTMEYTPIADITTHQESTKPAQSALLKLLSAEENPKMKTTTLATPSTVPPRTTTAPSLTTDPIFSHYKQPAKPIRGPMYLIIQGHSKVKTYKPTMNKHGVPVENNEIAENTTKLSKLEQLIRENTKGGIVDLAAEKRKLEEKTRAEKHASSRHESLMSLVESGLSGFTLPPSTEDERRASNSVTSIEIN